MPSKKRWKRFRNTNFIIILAAVILIIILAFWFTPLFKSSFNQNAEIDSLIDKTEVEVTFSPDPHSTPENVAQPGFLEPDY